MYAKSSQECQNDPARCIKEVLKREIGGNWIQIGSWQETRVFALQRTSNNFSEAL